MTPEAKQILDNYIKNISSTSQNDWPSDIYLHSLGLTNADLQRLMGAISRNPAAAKKITKLNLCGNQLTSFSGEGLGALQSLFLTSNQLTSFSGEGLGALQELYLADNQLTSFSGEGLGALQRLDLTDNQLTSFSGEGLGELQRLFLIRNQLTSFSGEGLGTLQWLFLEYNQLTSFSGEGLGALQSLDLTGNQLTSFSGEGLGELQRLDLTGNQLTRVCKIILEAMRHRLLLRLDYSDPLNAQAANQALTNAMLTEHLCAVLGTTQRKLDSTKSWLSMMRRSSLPDDMCMLVFECIYGQDHIEVEMDVIKRALPEQAENVSIFERSGAFNAIIKQYVQCIKSLREDSFKDAHNMRDLLTSYRQHRDTPDFRYLQDNTRLDPKNNPFQLTVYAPRSGM